MITEDYVSFEVAKLLKEKGFEGEVNSSYFGEKCIVSSTFYYPRCTHQMAMKWLREVHNVDIEIQAHVGMLGIKVYMPYASTYTPYKLNDVDIECGLTEDDVKDKVRQKKRSTRIPDKTELIPAHDWFNTYQEAVEAALKYCLTNLV